MGVSALALLNYGDYYSTIRYSQYIEHYSRLL
jgi:hypothetical protein